MTDSESYLYTTSGRHMRKAHKCKPSSYIPETDLSLGAIKYPSPLKRSTDTQKRMKEHHNRYAFHATEEPRYNAEHSIASQSSLTHNETSEVSHTNETVCVPSPSYAVIETASGHLRAPNLHLEWPQPAKNKIIRPLSMEKEPTTETINEQELHYRFTEEGDRCPTWDPFDPEAKTPPNLPGRHESTGPSSALESSIESSVKIRRKEIVTKVVLQRASGMSIRQILCNYYDDALNGSETCFLGILRPHAATVRVNDFALYLACPPMFCHSHPNKDELCQTWCVLSDANLHLTLIYRASDGKLRHYPILYQLSTDDHQQSWDYSVACNDRPNNIRPRFGSLRDLCNYYHTFSVLRFKKSKTGSIDDKDDGNPIVDAFAYWIDDKMKPKGRYCCV